MTFKNLLVSLLAAAVLSLGLAPAYAQDAGPKQGPAPAVQPQQQPQAQPDTQPAKPGEPFIIPLELLRQFMQQHAAPAQPTPAQLERVYDRVWQQVAESYHDPIALKNWASWRNKYQGKLTTVPELEAAIQEMLSSLNDPWTKYVSTSEIQAAQANLKAGNAPLGMSLKVQADGSYRVDFLVYGSAARGSNLREGDLVKSIGGKDVKGLTQKEVEALTMGKSGTDVEIVYEHKGVEQKVTLKFTAIPNAQVESKLLPGDIGYVRLPSFESEDVVAEFVGHIADLQKKSGGLKGLVLDLRGNPGGQFQLALEVASLFIQKGTVVSTTTRDGRMVTHTTFDVIPPQAHDFSGLPVDAVKLINSLYTVPLTVLVDGSTASSAEIVTGALKDNGRATVIGTTTFGKGVGYVTGRLPTGGVLLITTLDYLTPSGYNLANKGISPNVVVERPAGSAVDDQLASGVKDVMEKASKLTPNSSAAASEGEEDLESSPIVIGLGVALVFLVCVLFAVHYKLQRERDKNRHQ